MCQSWYALWAVSLAVLWLLPVVALVTQNSIAWVPLETFLIYFLPIPLLSTLMWVWAQRWFQPRGLWLSWRGLVLEIARWPVVVWALINVALRVKHSYMITPKGLARRTRGAQLLWVYGPYVVLASIPLAALWVDLLADRPGSLAAYYGLVLINGAVGVAMLVTVLLLELRLGRSGTAGPPSPRLQASIVATIVALVLGFAVTATATWEPFMEAIRW
jgi:cellulose synthase (UDP-forming)